MNLTETEDKEAVFFTHEAKTYFSSTNTFEMLPGNIFSYTCTKPYSYWFQKGKISTSAILDCGIKTGNNNTFVRLWYEVSLLKTAYSGSSLDDMEYGVYRWFKYSQGGGYRRWYGAIENIVDLEYNAERIKKIVSKATYRLRDKRKYFLQGMVWPMVGTNKFSCRLLPYDVLPDIASNVIYSSGEYQWDLLAYMNSKVFNEFMIMVNPTVNYPIDSVGAIPYFYPDANQMEEIKELCKENVELCKNDWNAFETSWDFQMHPLVPHFKKQNKNLVFTLKIGEKRWIEKLKEGCAWFGLVNGYITKAEIGNNDEQGDLYEGVFARCKKTDSLVSEMIERFGDDLEKIVDGEYYILRRKSSRRKYIFSMYGIGNDELEIQGNPFQDSDGRWHIKYRYEVEEKMYNNFLQGNENSKEVDLYGYYCSPGHLHNEIDKSLTINQYKWSKNLVDYDIDLSSEFFIEPTSDYRELFHKRRNLNYQHEFRETLINE